MHHAVGGGGTVEVRQHRPPLNDVEVVGLHLGAERAGGVSGVDEPFGVGKRMTRILRRGIERAGSVSTGSGSGDGCDCSGGFGCLTATFVVDTHLQWSALRRNHPTATGRVGVTCDSSGVRKSDIACWISAARGTAPDSDSVVWNKPSNRRQTVGTPASANALA